jgi:hypothetical protein
MNTQPNAQSGQPDAFRPKHQTQADVNNYRAAMRIAALGQATTSSNTTLAFQKRRTTISPL